MSDNTLQVKIPTLPHKPKAIAECFVVGRKLNNNYVENKLQMLIVCKLFSYLSGKDYTAQDNHHDRLFRSPGLFQCLPTPSASHLLALTFFTNPSWTAYCSEITLNIKLTSER